MTKLGQNFLINKEIVKDIVNIAEPIAGDCIVEIGPGKGILTEEILTRNPNELIAIEIDSALCDILRDRFSNSITLINQDATKINDYNFLSKNAKIIANLPYQVGTCLFINWMEHRDKFKHMVLMFQKEVAERITAQHGTRSYGYISVLASLLYDVKYQFAVSKHNFSPIPKIESAVITAVPNAFKCDIHKLKDFLKKIFAFKRKKLSNVMKISFNINDYHDDRRAEDIAPEELYDIFLNLKNV